MMDNFILLIIFGLVVGSRAEDVCPNEPPVWLAIADSIIPLIGILVSFSYFISLRCCTDKHKKYFLKAFRAISLLNWIVFWASCVILVLNCESIGKKLFKAEKEIEWVFITMMVVCWFVMMAESYVCRERWYIKRLGKKRPVLKQIERIWNTQPKVTWSVVGYALEESQVPVRTLKLSCATPVVKFDDSKEYVYKHWIDHSDDTVTGGGRKLVTRIKLNQEVQAGDAATRQDMEDKKQAWKETFGQRREAHVDFMEETSIRGFEKRMAVDESLSCCKRTKLCCVGCTCTYMNECCVECDGCEHCCLCLRESCTPVIIGKAQFWIFTVVGMTWPYRWLFKCITDKTDHRVQKKIYIENPENLADFKVRQYGEIIKDTGNINMVPDVEEAEEVGQGQDKGRNDESRI